MIVSLEWLRKFVDIEETPEQLAELLSNIGLEAEPTKVPISIPGVVIGKVENTRKHPNADKLKICNVSDGENINQVICGAPNVSDGQIIAYATIGAILPGNFKIKKMQIRGEESLGMICSERELCISDEHEGIMVLPENLILGEDFFTSYGYKFLSIELDITPNRSDAFSHLGVARDVAALTQRKLRQINVDPPNPNKEFNLDISLDNDLDCPRYIGGIIKNIRIGKSPDWLADYMKSIGQKSINNIVDISNFVLFELGHPTHIFDLDKLNEKKIKVRKAKPGEKIVTLDENEHELNDQNLLITSGDEPVALAGIMGGLKSSVTDKTTSLLLESAYFDPVVIRKSAKSLFLSTEASKRYERGVDPNGCLNAFYNVVAMICEITGGEFVSDVVDVYPKKITPKKVSIRRSEIDLVLGFHFKREKINQILESLEISYLFDNEIWKCTIPTFRPDIEREIDLIEEVARIAGFDSIPSDENIYGTFRYQMPDPDNILNKVRDTFSSFGFHQVYSNSLQNEKESSIAGLVPVRMLNPLNVEMGFLRTSLLPGLLKAGDFNIKNSAKSFRLYELGNVHQSNGDGLENIKESQYLSGIIYGNKCEPSIHSQKIVETIYDIKGVLVDLFTKRLNMNIRFEASDHYALDLAQNISINNKQIGYFGRVLKKFSIALGIDFDNHIYGFEINIDPIKQMMNANKIFKKINLFPTIERDINLVLKKEQFVEDILDVIHKLGKQLVVDVQPINIYSDDNSIGKDFKSVTFSIIFQHSSKTLEDTDVNSIINEIVNFAEKNFNAKLRV
tara:strand:- start:2430 stop:4808 length:2379 start_codon:yes stop_codon:yes gene_type:complete